MDEQILKILLRISQSEDGKDYLEYIMRLKERNYDEWKAQGGDVLRGKAICYDEIISLFQNCNSRIEAQKVVTQEWL